MGAYFDDLAKLYGKAIKAFYDAGCRYLQLDDTVWAYLCSEKELAQARERGEDADKLAGIYARVINTALKSKPADMVITTHVCRGNFRSTWISEGGYEPVAELLLAGIELRRLFPGVRHRARRRAGAAALPAQGQEARRGRPRHLQERRAGEEGRHQAPARRSGQVRARSISSACRRSAALPAPRRATCSAEDQQWAKLKMIVDISKEVWKS